MSEGRESSEGGGSHIAFDSAEKVFSLFTAASCYVLWVGDDGRLIHVGSAPVGSMGEARRLGMRGISAYTDTMQGWDRQEDREEFSVLGDTSYHDVAMAAQFPEPGGPLVPGEVFSGSVRDVRLRYVSHRIAEDEEPGSAPGHGLNTRVRQPRQTLIIHLRDTLYDFSVELFYRLTPEQDIFERWVEIRNDTSHTVQLTRLAFACLHLPRSATALVSLTGGAGREFQRTRYELAQGTLLFEHCGLNTGHAHNPVFCAHRPGQADEEHGDVFFGALAFSGNWSLRFETLPNGTTRVLGGYELLDFGMSLAPGQSHRTPAMLFGWSSEGIGGASRKMHRYLRERILPDTGDRPVLYNSWEATGFDVREDHQLELARRAASMGVELFCVDDGWFGGRAHSAAGLGDWSPRASAFPGGLKAFAEKIRALGMRFGLWVEPEMVNPDSDLYRAHPDWVLHYPGRPRTEARNQLVLDFGRPEVIEHLLRCLSNLVAEFGVDFLKWDMNRYATEAGSVAGQSVGYSHARGLYRIMDELRRRHPGLEIQTCSGGGGRVDPGIFARCDQAWISDNTDAHERVGIQEGYTLAYPARTMECWVTAEKNPLTQRISDLALRFDVAMRGALGIGARLDELTAGEIAGFRQQIAFYKRIRSVVQNGDLFRLDEVGRASASVWLFVSANRAQAVFSSIILATPHGQLRGPFRLCGLDASLSYRVTNCRNEEVGCFPGWQLMAFGLPDDHLTAGACRSVRSRTLLLEGLNPDDPP